MDKEAKSAGSTLSGNSVLAVLLLAAGAFVLHEAPLQGTRPAANEPRVEQRFAEQDIDARLWQDPFGAVERGREEVAKKLPPGTQPTEAERRDPARLVATIEEKFKDGVTEVDVLAVMVPGGPYAEQVESRRRTRYAVLAGLNASHHAPIDTEHVGYFLPRNNAKLPRDLPFAVPFEWFEPASTPIDPACRQAHKPTAAARGPVKAPACQLRHVLVLWLDNGAFNRQPFDRVARLFAQLQPRGAGAPVLRWRVLGPSDSGGLRAMVEESSTANFDAGFFRDCDVRFYSPSATVPDAILLERVSAAQAPSPGAKPRPRRHCLNQPVPATADVQRDGPHTLAHYFGTRGISLVRTINDDQKLAASLIDELQLRLLPGKPDVEELTCPKSGVGSLPYIAVVTELDTLYGRSLRRQFQYDLQRKAGFCVDRFQYVRGIDGQLPERASANAASPDKDTPKPKTDPKDKDGSLIERAEGQSQFDYLRRLAARLRERDDELRAASSGRTGIRAIGVLGNDLHDKLLVLQALKPDFPDAVFFTTDLDVRFLHPREQGWTRNLVVASSFGLRLTDRLQSGAPPFRDSYQTSAFFATSLAMAEINNSPPFLWSQAQVTRRLQAPRVFEIGRTAAFAFSPARSASAPGDDAACERDDAACAARSAPSAPSLAGMAWLPAAMAAQDGSPAPSPSCGNKSFDACVDIHPPPSRAYPEINTVALTMICSTLLLLLWAPALALSRPMRRQLRRYLAAGMGWNRHAAIAAGLLLLQVGVPLLMADAWPVFARWLTERGKPISFTEGISIWPTEAIRLLTLLLCIYLLFRGWTALQRNLDDISLKLRIGKTRRQLVAEQDRQDAGQPWCRRINNMFSNGSADPPPPDATTDPRMTPGTMAFWKRYIVQSRTSSRFMRSLACVFVMTLLGVALYAALDESPGVPVRGGISNRIHDGLAFALFLAMNFLIFCVADATLLCVRLVRELRWRNTNWPERSLNWFQSRLGPLPAALVDHWIDLQFIARRTQCVTGLVYYPFIVLSLLLVSRSAVFDNWRMPLALPLMSMLSIGVVLVCIVALRLAAENSRAHALTDVKEALLRAQARGALGEPAPEQLKLLQGHIEGLRDGAFAPFAQQPLLKALVMPFATWGGTTLLDYMAMASI
ncbi:MAG TPA: hypothetical protein VFL64_08120 [Rhizobacter sp.]|nr:hypothetical protein [Rhizobacter sp.]